MDARAVVTDFVDEAVGRGHRADPALPRTGGPAGNARLTAWTGVLLLALFLAELVTLLDVRSLIGWHIAIGVLLIPPALLKTATTGWRIARYYAGNAPYRTAGPPPLALRVLGPLVVASTLAVLGTGVVVLLVDPATARDPWLTVGRNPVDLLTLHKAAFVVWAVATGLHTLGRLVPAARLTVVRGGAAVAGRASRAATIALAVAASVLAVLLALSVAGPWQAAEREPRDHRIRHEGR